MKILMKSLITLVIAGVIGITGVNAMSESELQNVLTKPYVINGVTYQATTSEKAQIERYLAQNNVSEEDADYIAKKVNEAVEIITKSGVKVANLSELPTNVKNQLKSLATDITANTDIKLTVNKGSITVYNIDGTVFGEITSVLIKQTDNSVAIIASIALIVTVVGAFMVVRQVKSKTVTYA